MSSTTPAAKPKLITLEGVALVQEIDGSIGLSITAGGRVVYRETFKNWDTALDVTPYVARAWARGVIPGEHHDDGVID